MSTRLLLGAWLLLAAGQQEVDPDALAEIRAGFEKGKAGAEARVREAKQAAAAATREETERDARIEKTLKEYTAKTPIRMAISEKLIVDQIRVTGYLGGRVYLTWPQGEVEYPLELLPEETRATLVGVALSKASPRDHFEMGKVLVRGKDYERAARCFATAAQRDPSLASFVPDLERLKRAGRLFEGAFRAAGNTLSLRWGFSSTAEESDFQALQGTASIRPGQGLEVDGPKVAITAIREIPFCDRVRLSVLARETEAAAHLTGIRFVKPNGGEVLIYGALITSAKTFMVVKIEDGKTQEVLAPTPGAVGTRMTMDFNRGRFVFQVGEKTVWSGSEGGFTDVLVIVGAVGLPRPNGAPVRAMAQFQNISLSGEVNPQWLIKKTAGLREATASELTKEHRIKRDGKAASSLDLSIDSALLRAPAPAQESYKAALSKIAAMKKSQLKEDLENAAAAIEQVTLVHPAIAAAWYWRGVLSETAGDRRAAAEHLDKALALLPDFPEAHCARGSLLMLAGKVQPARERVDRALALKPDLAEGHLLRARLLWETRDAAAVLEATELARRLAPSDPDLHTDAQMLANVARGPRWPRPNTHATAHYAVRSDLPAAKCRLYAEHLEAVRSHYQEVLGRALLAEKAAEVLIFESEEGYFIYNDYTIGSRQEHTLGAFSPWHGQMALFEGLEAAETLRVLAHEGFHQVLHGLAPDAPIWFNEGMAEYVGAARVEKGKVVERGVIQSGRLENLKFAVKYGWQPVPFERIMLESQEEFYGPQAAFKYAQAWSMIWYFMDGDGGRWKSVLQAYIARLMAGDPARAAYDATFAKQDLKTIEASWLKHYGLVVNPAAAMPVAGRPGVAKPADPVMTEPPVDLIARLAAKGPVIQGWTLKGSVLEYDPRPPYNALDLGHEPPAEYDWTLVARREGPGTGVIVGLQGGGSTFILKLDHWNRTGLELLDGRDAGNPSTVNGVVFRGDKTATIVCSVRKTGVRVTSDGELLLEWKGDFRRLSFSPSPGIPPTRNLFLAGMGTRFFISSMSVKTVFTKPAPPAVKPPPPKVAVNPARSIPLGCDITRWIVDEDGRQILALDPTGNLLQISISDMKILRKIAVGGDPGGLCLVPGSTKSAWVSSRGGQCLVRIDLEKGEATDRVPVPFVPTSVVAFRKYVFYLAQDSGIAGVDVSDKKDLGKLGTDVTYAMAYDPRKDRFWVLGASCATDYDATKIGVLLRERTRKNLAPREAQELQLALYAAGKNYSIGLFGGTKGFSLLVDSKNGRIYLNRSGAKLDKIDGSVVPFQLAAHSLQPDPAVQDYLLETRIQDQLLAFSPDGKWVASGAQILNVATALVHKEIPLPTSLVAFSKDSKELCYYDWVNKLIAVMEVEGK